MNTELNILTITSPAFEHGGKIPEKYTCMGENISPELRFSGIPSVAKSLVLIVDDHDVPAQIRPECYFDHWIVFNIPPETTVLPQGATIGVMGQNGSGENRYTGPCPPTKYRPTAHHYNFRVLALDTILELSAGA